MAQIKSLCYKYVSENYILYYYSCLRDNKAEVYQGKEIVQDPTLCKWKSWDSNSD